MREKDPVSRGFVGVRKRNQEGEGPSIPGFCKKRNQEGEGPSIPGFCRG